MAYQTKISTPEFLNGFCTEAPGFGLEPGSRFSSVVFLPERLSPWPKLCNDEPLALLHAKFWGKSMADEEQEWRNAQLPIPTIGGGVGDEGRHADERMGEDERTDEGDNDDDDIIPGCYVLNIGIDGLEYSKIWVRADYIRIYNFLEDYHADLARNQGKAPGAVLTGQPGIGKSVWIFYALRRRLAEKKPVIWYRDSDCYLFVEEGVYKQPRDFPPSYFRTFVWTLVDSDEAKNGVPEHLVAHGTCISPIFSSSPAEERWRRLEKTLRRVVVVMNPWTKREIRFAAPLILSGGDLNFDRIYEIYDQFGPIPRLCIDKLSELGGLEAYQAEVLRALRNLSLKGLEDLVEASGDLTMNAASHKLCLVRRMDPTNVISKVQVTPITDFIASKLALYLRNLEQKKQIRAYKTFAATPSSRGMSGCIFEAYCQSKFQSQISIELLPMVRIDGKSGKKRQPRWHTSHYPLTNDNLERKHLEALRNIITLQIRPSSVFQYFDNELEGLHLLPDVYYIPTKTNEVALDSFILHDGYIYFFQFAGGKTHGINDGLISLLAKCVQLPTRDKWRFIFIMPDDSQLLRSPFPQRIELQELMLFSSRVAVEFTMVHPRKEVRAMEMGLEVDDQEESAGDLKAPKRKVRSSTEEEEGSEDGHKSKGARLSEGMGAIGRR